MSSDPATATDAGLAWLPALLQAGDSSYPTGTYAHSFGLEGLVQDGTVRDAATLRTFLRLSVLPGLRHADLPLAAHAWRALDTPDWDLVGELCVLGSALRSPREARAASEGIGRQRAELAARLHDAPLAHEFLRRAAAHGWPIASPVAAALEGRIAGAPLAAVLAGLAYGQVNATVAAAMKLLRLGQNGAQTLLTEALATLPPLVAAAGAAPRGEIGWSNPWLDVASARHEAAPARMFIS